MTERSNEIDFISQNAKNKFCNKQYTLSEGICGRLNDIHSASQNIGLHGRVSINGKIIENKKESITLHRFSILDSMKQFHKEDNETNNKQIIEKHIIQNNSKKKHKHIYFDKAAVTNSNQKLCLLSCKGWKTGIHEFIIEITKCDVYTQEIGVISTLNISNIQMDDDGIKTTKQFGARTVFGSRLSTNSTYYGSWNQDGRTRCYRDLSNGYKIGWCSGDIIKVCLNLNEGKVRYYLNGIRVRKTMSLQKGKRYYPIIAFAGNCQYQLIK